MQQQQMQAHIERERRSSNSGTGEAPERLAVRRESADSLTLFCSHRFSVSGSPRGAVRSSSHCRASSAADGRSVSPSSSPARASAPLRRSSASSSAPFTCGWVRGPRDLAGRRSGAHRPRRHDRRSQTATRAKGLSEPQRLPHSLTLTRSAESRKNHLL